MAFLQVNGNQLVCGAQRFHCAVGRGGFSSAKREGDGCTPLGVFPLRECWYRSDRLKLPKTGLALKPITVETGWCDDPRSPDYNRPVLLPFAFSHEKLWREDNVYDLIVPLGYNDDPVIPGLGSAIFLHVAHERYEPTEGCVALARSDLLDVLALCDNGTVMEIRDK